jgi:hypothetical protein
MAVPLPDFQIKAILNTIHSYGTTLIDFVTSVLQSTDCEAHQSADCILRNPEVILEIIGAHPISQSATQKWAKGVMIEVCRQQVLELTKKENGLHFTASNTTEERIDEFNMSFLTQKMESLAPDLWHLLRILLAADPWSNYQRSWSEKRRQMNAKRRKRNRVDVDIEIQDVGDSDLSSEGSDAEYWAGMQSPIPEEEDEIEDILDHVEEQQRGLMAMVSSTDFHAYTSEQ